MTTRFQYDSTSRRKLTNKIDFPINSLDVKPYMASSRLTQLKEIETKINNGNDISTDDDILDTSICTQYDLYSAVHHVGAMGGGHYVTTVREIEKKDDKSSPHKSNTDSNTNENGLWYCYNDNIVNAVNDTKEVCSSSAYVLFYVRKDIKGSPYTYTLPKFKPSSVKYNIGEERDDVPQLPTDIEDDNTNNANDISDKMKTGNDQRRVKHTTVLRQGPKKVNPENDTSSSSTWRPNMGNKDQCNLS